MDVGAVVERVEHMLSPLARAVEVSLELKLQPGCVVLATGLGLSIVRDTVLQHGGAVTARRREPEGTCFEVSFAQWNGEEVGR